VADCVPSSSEISTRAEAQEYYRRKLVGAHHITCRGQSVDIVFESTDTHIYSEKVADINAIPEDQLVKKNLAGGKRECRQFCLDRAKLMDQILPAISLFVNCTGGDGGSSRAPRLVHGPKMPCGRYMRVVLRRGAGKSWVVLTAFPLSQDDYRKTTFSRPAPFP
jgi:hypothetical protein